MNESYSKPYLWLLAIRPKTLPAAAAPVLVGAGAAVANDLFSLLPALFAFLGALLLQIAVNLANDYFDARNKIDSEARLGPTRVTQSGLIPASQVWSAMVVTLIVAALIFGYLGWVGGWPICLVGICSILAALAYSGGPYPIASNGLGELFVFIFFGLVAVCGTYWVQALSLSWLVVVASVPPGLLIAAIMLVNNYRDRETDEQAGKITLAVRLGKTRSIRLYQALIGIPYLIPVLLFPLAEVNLYVLAPLSTLPLAIRMCKDIKIMTGRELNEFLAKTAKLSFLFSLLFAIGLAF